MSILQKVQGLENLIFYPQLDIFLRKSFSYKKVVKLKKTVLMFTLKSVDAMNVDFTTSIVLQN